MFRADLLRPEVGKAVVEEVASFAGCLPPEAIARTALVAKTMSPPMVQQSSTPWLFSRHNNVIRRGLNERKFNVWEPTTSKHKVS